MEKKIRTLIKDSMINKDKVALTTYKSILENAQKLAKDKKEDVNDSYIITSIKKEIKQLEDLFSYCKEGTDKYAETKRKIDIATSLLTQMTSEDEILDYLTSNKVEKNMGLCMRVLKVKFKDTLDGKIASQVVKKYINS
jgi:uncharacterized protein YqeY